ncbi:nuclear pore complex protein Nup153 isoform X2 [Apodemus sylvaticus]|uniref:nuclear pore complex protein Nup153 isoform X2 n=1 Tax=Apodemus sylvaticus TaxID=10129 RepID=UPI002243F47C|nr:nuclear pore complex protein Nup153 isoform X2 [Apodemus sylvaticus]
MASGAGGIGGGGGGKIRTRRCHQGPVKPYQQGRPQHQGILSRVTESVKNIVPGWLQRYFNKSENACSYSPDADEVPPWPENREDEHAIYADENTNTDDGRVTPEPAGSNTEEPSTTSTASNYPDVLTRPSLHRSHLNFSVLESPALHCQPSTSSAFPIGSSGFSLVKEIKDSTSQHDDDNISTTSGFSSRASEKDIAVSKNTSLPPLWSPEAERSHSLSQHTAISSKKPAFNLSAFGTLSTSLGNSSILKTSQLGDSPFYPGKTTYGGAAAAVRQNKVRSTPYQAPVRRQMKAKQLNAQSYGVTSSTARRILQSLEKMSSPLADAKRIPSAVSSPLNSPLDRSGIDSTVFQAKKEKTVDEKNISRQNREQESGFSYPNFSIPAANGLSSGGGKMRRERTHIVAPKPPEEEEMEAPLLPQISLPISSSSLPTFSFSSPVISASPSPVSPSQPLPNKVQMTSLGSTGSPVFTFSSPIVKSTQADVLPPASIGFTFSVPLAKTELSGSNSSSETVLSSSAQDNTVVNSSSYKKRSAPCEDPFTPAKILREGSVLDILKTPGFMSPKVDSPALQPTTTSSIVYTRPAISTFSSSGIEFGESLKAGSSWQCDTCLLQNKVTDNKCIACQAAKLPLKDTAKQTGIGTPSKSDKPASTSGTGFGDKFKPAIGTWDCDTCLVQNKPEAVKCVACETPKPGTGVKRVLTLTVASESPVTASSSTTVTTGTLGFGDKFKRPVGSWECPVCCVCNKAEDNRCVSCTSEKPGLVSASSSSPVPVSLSSGGCLGLDKFKKPEGSWDCEVCLVQNKADSTKCIACESAKPGTKSEFKGFGTSSSLNPAPSAFKFGIPSSSSGLSQTFTSTGNFKFGDQGGFKLGTSSDSGSTNTMNSNFKFSKPTGDFKFGVLSDSKPEEIKNDSKNDNFQFGPSSGLSNAASSAPFQFGASTLGQQEKKEDLPKSSSTGFSFGAGVNNPPNAAIDTTVTSENKSGFTFGTVDTKSVSVTPFTYKTTEAKKEDASATKGGFTFGKVEPASLPSASMFVLGRTEEKQQEPVTSTSLVFGKKADNEEPKCQPVFSFGNSEQTKDESSSSSKPTFSFSVAKPSVKESDQLAKATFAFGNQTNTTTDQGAAKPVFSFLNSSSSSSSAPATSSSGGIFGSSTSSSNPPVAAFVFGQASNPVSSSAFGNSAESSTSQSLLFPQDSKPATTSSAASAASPFVFGTGASSNSTVSSGFTFGATTTSSSSGSSFVFGTGHSAPSASPAFGANQTPTFGQSQGASQPNPPSFGSISSSTAIFSAGSQPVPPPTFGTVSSSSQPPVFGQQPSQSAFGSGTASAGSVFQFGSSTTNFNFTNNNPSGVFTFGASPSTPAASAQPSGSGGFSFSQSPASFTVGSNGKNMFSSSGTSVSGRKIKTAVRRRK